MSAKSEESPILRYDPKTFGYSVISEAPEVSQNHKSGRVYFSEEVLEREIEEIFMKEWLLVGRAEEVEKAIEEALYCAKICAYAQGFQLMRAAEKEYDWTLNFSDIAKIWRGGCIIRASFLQRIADAFDGNRELENLLLSDYFADTMAKKQGGLRKAVVLAAQSGVPTPAFFSALAYFDGYRSEVLPANLLQAQRDYFGAHTYERVDGEPGQKYHTFWQEEGRPERKV